MRVLIACEFSGIVRDAFIARGHEAVSCDLLPSERPGPHIQGDVLEHLNDGWDLMIAHPPCTYLTWAGARYWNDEGREDKRKAALRFFMQLYHAPISKVAIENPRGYITQAFRRQDQEVNPFDFGEPIRKRVCLWLKNLPPLLMGPFVQVDPSGSCIKTNGRKYNYYYHQGKTGKGRSRFFASIANAMAEQWGS